MIRRLTTMPALAAALALGGCVYPYPVAVPATVDPAVASVGTGMAVGAATGALIGSVSGDVGTGAAIGAGVGALGGLLAEQRRQREWEEREAAARWRWENDWRYYQQPGWAYR